jgi:hypothetical protein
MKKLTRYFIAVAVLVLWSCTYNLPPNGNASQDGNMTLSQSPKSLKALKNVLMASDHNRVQEYGLLRSQLDSSTQLISQRIVTMQDSMMRVNKMLEFNSRHIQNQLNNIQLVLYIIMGLVLGLILYVLYRLPVKHAKKIIFVEKQS